MPHTGATPAGRVAAPAPKAAVRKAAVRTAAVQPADACAAPGAPGTVSARAGKNSVTVTWGAGADNGTAITSYTVRAANGLATAVGPATRTTSLTGLAASTATTVSVVATSDCGTGPAATSASVTPSGNATTYASSVIGAAPAAYYRLDDASDAPIAADSSGKGRVGTYGSGADRPVGGALGTLDPDAAVNVNANCCVATSSGVGNLYAAGRTVSAWVKPADTQGRWFVGWGGSDTDTAFNVGLQGSNVLVDAGGDQLTFPSGRNLTDGVWHDIAVTTSSSSSVSVYVDGLPVGTRTLAGDLDTLNDSGLVIGAFNNGGGAFYGGLDDVAVFTTTLPASTISAQFQASGYRRPAAPTHVSAVDGGDNEAVVSWAVGPSYPAITRYVVTAISSTGTKSLSSVVAGNKTAARVTGLAGGSSYSFSVFAGNAYGLGPATTSASATIGGPTVAYASTVAASNPSAYYRFGESSGAAEGADSSGHGVLLDYSQAQLDVDGAIPADLNTAASGNGSCCLATAGSSLPQYNEARSVEFWVRPTDTSARWVAGWGRSETDTAFNVGIANQTIMVSGYDDDLTFPTKRTLVDGVWHQVVVTYDGTTASTYLDGASLGSKTFVNPLDTLNESGLVVGAAEDGGAPYLGDLDELAVFSSALSGATVAAHFSASGHAAPAAPTGVTATSGANSATATWTPPVAGNDGVTSYLVTALKGTTPTVSVVASADATSATLTGLSGGSAVSLRVVAMNAYGSGVASTSAPVTPSGSATTYASTVLAQNPLAYYRLSETAGTALAADSSGKAPSLTTGEGTFGDPGSLNSDPDTSATADGNCCLGSTPAALPVDDDSRTVEAWVKPGDTNMRWLLGWGGDAGQDSGFDVGVQDNTVLVSAVSDDLSFTAGSSLADGSWHQVAVTYDGTSVRAYVDSVLIGTKSFVSALLTSDNATLQVGGYSNGGAYYGGLDEVAIFRGALPAATITAQFAASGHGVPGAPASLTASAGSNSASVSWSPPTTADPVNAYVVTAYKGGTIAANAMSVSGSTTSTTLTGLAGGTPYTIRVVARDGYGTGAPATSASLTPSGAASTYASTVIGAAPAFYARLGDGDGSSIAADSSGRGHQGAYGLGGSPGAAGALPSDPDTAATANATCCIATASAAGEPSGNSARTVEAWVQPSDTGTRWFLGWGATALDRGFDVGVQGSNVVVSSYGDDLTIPAGRNLADGAWHHVVVTYDGTSVRAYVDAVALPSRTFANTLHTVATGSLAVGSFQAGGGPFYGGLDEVAVFPAALSQAQVSAHFAASGHSIPSTPTGVTATLRANAVAVSWNASTSFDGVRDYLVTALAGSTPVGSVVVAGTTTSATVTGLVAGTAVTVRVVATNGYGNSGPGTSAAVTPTGTSTTYASNVLAQSPLAYYRFSEATGVPALADSTGRTAPLTAGEGTFGSTGAIVADASAAAVGDGGCCLGTGTATLPKYNAARSVEAWVRPSDGQQRWIVGWGTDAIDRSFDLGVRDDTVVVSGYADDLSFAARRSLVDGAWHQVVATYDGSVVTVYLDGVSLGSKSFHAALNTVTSGALTVGGYADSSGPWYGGLDELSIYGAALTSAQVAAHFAASGHKVPGAPTGVTATAQANGVAVHWTAASPVVDGTSRYVVTVLSGATPLNAKAVKGSATAVVITGLPAGMAVSARVVPGNAYGDGPAGTSSVVTPTGAATTYASLVRADAPAAYYRLGDGSGSPAAADSSGRGATLVYGSQATAGGPGALPHDTDTSVTADGSGTIAAGYATTLPAYNTSRTVEAWVKPASGNLGWVVDWGTNQTDRNFAVGVQDSTVVVSAYGDDVNLPVGRSLVDGAWHQIDAVYASGTVRVYVDGVSVGTLNFTNALNTITNGRLVVGAELDGSSPWYGGLDEVSIYPTALSATRVSAHYAAR